MDFNEDPNRWDHECIECGEEYYQLYEVWLPTDCTYFYHGSYLKVCLSCVGRYIQICAKARELRDKHSLKNWRPDHGR